MDIDEDIKNTIKLLAPLCVLAVIVIICLVTA
jgi:hypothetical protein